MSSALQSMAAVQTADRTIEIREIDLPDRLGANEGLLKVEANGVCGTDVEQYHGRLHASGWAAYPQIPGHEAFGRIAWVGEEAAKIWDVTVGDRVSMESNVPCWVCPRCRTGKHRFCRQARFQYGFVPVTDGCGLWGGMSEYMVVRPGTVLHRVPENLPVKVAAFYNPLAAGFEWALRVGGVGAGDRVAIFGPGQRGLGALIAARKAGASQVIVTGLASDAHKLELCEHFGATATIVADEEDVAERVKALTGGDGADVVLDLTPVATQPIIDAIECTAPYGTIVLAGIKGMRAVDGLVSDKVVLRGLSIRGALPPSYWALEQSFETLASDPEGFAAVPTQLVELPEAEHAIKLLGGEAGGEKAMHVAIVPPVEAADALRTSEIARRFDRVQV